MCKWCGTDSHLDILIRLCDNYFLSPPIGLGVTSVKCSAHSVTVAYLILCPDATKEDATTTAQYTQAILIITDIS